VSSSKKIIVQAMIIHRILKKENQKNRTPPVIRQNLHTNDDKTVKLIKFLDDLLDQNGLAHSHASNFAESSTASKLLNDHLFKSKLLKAVADEEVKTDLKSEKGEQTQYRRLSNKLTHALDYHIYQSTQTTGDHLPIIFYKQGNVNYLYMALLSLEDTITIDEKTGDIIDTSSINKKALKVAFKINLDKMKQHASGGTSFKPENYVSWIQKGSDKIPEYIQDYIPVKYRIDDKKATSKLIKKLGEFLSQSEFDNASSEKVYEQVIQLLKDKVEHKQEVNIVEDVDTIIVKKAKACAIDTTNTINDFKAFRELNGYSENDNHASNIFTPEKDSLSKFEKFTLSLGSYNPIRITGTQEDIGHTIKLNDKDPKAPFVTITIKPEDLSKARDILKKPKPYESDPD
jgi:nucleoid-associated protein